MSGQSVAAIVAAHIEAETRFEAADLELVEEEAQFSVPLELRVTQTVLYATPTASGAGHLPQGVVHCNSQNAFRNALQSALDAAQEAAPHALQAWADREPGSYRRLLPGQSSIGFAAKVYGFEHRCEDCGGHADVVCPGCKGTCYSPCLVCAGQGRVTCGQCQGSQAVRCSSCSGRGQWTEQDRRDRWDHARNMYVADYVQVHRSCQTCGGRGRQTCGSCAYGKVDCRMCQAGRLNCGTCGASGSVPCRPCAATGVRHMHGQVASEVVQGEMLTVDTQDERLRQLVVDKLDRADLPGLGALLETRHEAQGSTLATVHRLRLDVRRAVIEAAERRFEIHGFGPEPAIHDFCDIASHLLQGDLRALQEQVAASSGWRRGRSKALLQAVADFLRSELNLRLAERLAAQKRGADASQNVAGEFHGLVDAAYVQAATEALRTALKRAYGSELAESAAYLCGLTALAAGAMAAIGAPTFGPWAPVGWGVAAACAIWFVLEEVTHRRIARNFPADLGGRILGQLAAGDSVQRWRVGMVFGLGMSAIAGPGAVRQLPWVHEREAGEALIANWDFQPTADFQQRRYPPNAMLRARAQAGDVRAQEILAWQLLLGAGGVRKDVAEAARWIEQARPAGAARPLWRAAHALLVLNQDALPDAIRMAARELGTLGDRMAEARYWDARVRLNPQSPVHDVRAGIAKLEQAADRGHARAALALGERYAAGNGVRRDPVRARRYLGIAERAGLPGASEQLAKLR